MLSHYQILIPLKIAKNQIEAHLVQLFYLTQHNIERLRSFGYAADTFAAEIKNVIARGKLAPLNFILQAKTRELI